MARTEENENGQVIPLDAALAQLYRYWSRTAHCCGWVMLDDGILEEFEEWLRTGGWRGMADLQDNREDLTGIREAWMRAAGGGEEEE